MNNPQVSIVIPHTWDRPLLCMDSIKKQTHKNLEIIIEVDNLQEGPGRPRNQGASIVNSDYIAFCDDDIELEPTFIERLLDVLERNPEADFAYCDYNKTGIHSGIENSQPWNPEFLKKRNYISTMSMVRTGTFPGFDEGLKRYVDWDLWLKYAEAGLKGIYVPRVLFTAHFDGKGISTAGPYSRLKHTNILKKKWGINNRTYSIIIAVHNELEKTRKCIESLVHNTGDDYEIIIIDDASTDGTAEYLDGLGEAVRVFTNLQQMHHSASCNLGAQAANGDYLIFLNNDTVVPFPWNVQLREQFDNIENASCIGPVTTHSASCQEIRVKSENGAGIDITNIKIVQDEIRRVFAGECILAKITGFCFFTSRKVWEKVGQFEEAIPAGGNEGEWIIRASEHGLFPYIDTRTFVFHHGNASYSKEDRKGLWSKGRQFILDNYGQEKLDWLENELYLDIYQEFKLVISR